MRFESIFFSGVALGNAISSGLLLRWKHDSNRTVRVYTLMSIMAMLNWIVFFRDALRSPDDIDPPSAFTALLSGSICFLILGVYYGVVDGYRYLKQMWLADRYGLTERHVSRLLTLKNGIFPEAEIAGLFEAQHKKKSRRSSSRTAWHTVVDAYLDKHTK